MSQNLPVQTLDYDGLRESFIAFLKSDTTYTDVDFQASGISTLINILAYNSHLLGWYTKMLIDESSVDTAHTRKALYSLAKNVGYIPKGKKCAKATLQISVTMPINSQPASGNILIPKFTTFNSVNNVLDTRIFTLMDDVLTTIANPSQDGLSITYTTEPFQVFEGVFSTWQFKIDSSIFNQQLVIEDETLDYDTLQVSVTPFEGSEDITYFEKSENALTLAKDSEVFFVTTNEEGYYQVFFGKDVNGKQPADNAIITAYYIATNGETGNGAKVFTINKPAPNPLEAYNIGNFSNIVTTTIENSSGGLSFEDLEELRNSIPTHFKRQNRLVTESDYKTAILTSFRNVDSISVWGGETAINKSFGKVLISIKPKDSDKLTTSAKQEIVDKIVKNYGMVGIDVDFIDPDYVNVLLEVFVKVDLKKTNKTFGDIQGEVLTKVSEYNSTILNKFDTFLSDINLLNYIKTGNNGVPNDYIISVYTAKKLQKTYKLLQGTTANHTVFFGNALQFTNALQGVLTNNIIYASKKCRLLDLDGSGNLFLADVTTLLPVIATSLGTINYSTGILTFTLPTFARIEGFESSTYGDLLLTVVPKVADIFTVENNIVRISQTVVKVS